MADERSTPLTWEQNPDQEKYDKSYHDVLLPLMKGTVLDLGCGVGMFTRNIVADKVYAIDKFPINKRIYDKTKVVSLGMDITNGFSLSESVDVVVSTEFIEHITKEDFIKVIANVKKVLKDGGLFCGSTPNKVSPTTNPYHLQEYTVAELKELLEAHFSSVEAYGNEHYCTIWTAIK